MRSAARPLVDGGLNGGLGCEDPGGPGEVHGHRVHVDARDGGAKLIQDILGVEVGFVRGGLDEVGDGLGDEGAGAAGGVEDALVQRVGHDLAHHGLREPVRGVVLA